MKDSKKRHPVFTTCPTCKHDLYVTKLECEHCDTSIEGSFGLSKFNYLDSEKLYFIEIFVKNRGSIKAIEKELNISYPTVKKMLDDVIVGLGYSLDEESEQPTIKETSSKLKASILEQIEKGELSVEKALKMLKKGE